MKSLDQTVASFTNRVLVYGPPKAGKTKLYGGLAKKYKLLVIDLENGNKTLRSLPLEYQKNIFVLSLPDTRVYPIAAETCLAMIKGAKGTVCEDHSKWNCLVCKKNARPSEEIELNALGQDWIVCFDSLTQLSNSIMAHLTRTKDDLYKPEWEDYRNQGALLDKFLSQVQQAPFNCCCVTHETETKMEDGKAKLVPIAGTTNFSRNTAKYFDDVVYCNVVNKKHGFASSSTWSNQVLTGSRGSINIEDQEEPSLLPFFDQEYLKNKAENPDEPSVPREQKQATSRLQEILAKAKGNK